MIKAVFVLLFVFYTLSLKAQQNLVPNGSFEEIGQCYGQPADLGFDVFQWSGCSGWECPTLGSSDLWCENPILGSYSPPYVGLGYQQPRTGENMSAIYSFVLHEEYREYIQSELSATLQDNTYYHFSMYVNNSFYDETFSAATSCLGVYLSEYTPYQPTSYLTLPVVPQIKNDPFNYYTDTLEWTLFEGDYKASGGEKFMTIGCFEDDTDIHLSREITDTTGGSIYLFIDDVSLLKIPAEVHFPNVFTPNDDGDNDDYLPLVKGVPDWEVIIVNRWGIMEATLNDKNPSWNGKTENGYADDGVYFYVLNSSRDIFRQHGFFHLIR